MVLFSDFSVKWHFFLVRQYLETQVFGICLVLDIFAYFGRVVTGQTFKRRHFLSYVFVIAMIFWNKTLLIVNSSLWINFPINVWNNLYWKSPVSPYEVDSNFDCIVSWGSTPQLILRWSGYFINTNWDLTYSKDVHAYVHRDIYLIWQVFKELLLRCCNQTEDDRSRRTPGLTAEYLYSGVRNISDFAFPYSTLILNKGSLLFVLRFNFHTL